MKHNFILIALLLFLPVVSLSADDDVKREKPTPGILRPVKSLMRLIDTMAVSGIDRRYIDAPERPWQVILRGNVNQTNLKMKSKVDLGMAFFGFPIEEEVVWEPHVKNTPSTYAGIWAGYRGYGIGYSKNIAGDKGSYFTLGATGGSYGVNLRIHRFQTNKPNIRYYDEQDPELQGNEEMDIDDPIRVHTLILDGYYFFNGKRFSYAAAYDQSAIQKRSAGSLMVGAMYYYGHIDYATNANAPLLLFMDDIGQMRQWQVCLGAGYAYNWVPARGWLVSAMFMPMASVYNRLKLSRYSSNFTDYVLDMDNFDKSKIHITPEEEITRNSSMQLNFDTRLSLTYQWDRYSINAYGQINNFRYKHENSKGNLTDWLAWLQLGVRF